jgi:hypothetical protein
VRPRLLGSVQLRVRDTQEDRVRGTSMEVQDRIRGGSLGRNRLLRRHQREQDRRRGWWLTTTELAGVTTVVSAINVLTISSSIMTIACAIMAVLANTDGITRVTSWV